MTLADELKAIKDAPGNRLTEPCVLALGAFLAGYKMADASVGPLLGEAAQRFPSSAEADVTSKAFLAFPNTEEALIAVLDDLLLAGGGTPTVALGPAAATHIVDWVRGPIESGRTGMLLLEPTTTWLANCVRGHTAGLRVIGSARAQDQEQSFVEFECWLRREYHEPAARWDAILRIYEGADIHGLQRFIHLWDAFQASRE